ncbi:signal recognition particle subunit [Lobaria immixta]|nr:signal recognition particle subunit [Lobaria immixta]
MPQHPRIEEVSDSDLGDSDPSEQDPDDFAPAIIRPSSVRPPANPSHQPQPQPQFRAPTSNFDNTNDRHKRYQCLYPLYFDANRSRSQGRRVGQELAVQNPLAREIVDAVQLLGLDTVFEPGKLHPKDWSNPGRVRVLVKEGGRVRNRGVKNKHHLYTLVSKHLLAHPTTPSSPLRMRIHGMPTPDQPIPPPAVPRGWKMNTILPLHSPALSGGGVSENILKDMMQEMQAGQVAQGGASSGGGQIEGGGQGKRKREGGKKR